MCVCVYRKQTCCLSGDQMTLDRSCLRFEDSTMKILDCILSGECGCFNPKYIPTTGLPRKLSTMQKCKSTSHFRVLHKNQQKFKSNVHYKEPFNCYLFLIHYHIIIIITTITIIVMSLANGVSPNGSLPISSTLLGLILLMKHLDDTISVHTTHISRSSSIADLCNIRHVPQFPTTRSMKKNGISLLLAYSLV